MHISNILGRDTTSDSNLSRNVFYISKANVFRYMYTHTYTRSSELEVIVQQALQILSEI